MTSRSTKRFWCCGGRLPKSNLPYSVIYPYFIPKEHYFATLIILKGHDDIKHNEVRGTINNLREEFQRVETLLKVLLINALYVANLKDLVVIIQTWTVTRF